LRETKTVVHLPEIRCKLTPMSSAKPLGLESNNQVEQAELILNQQRP
jgi:hypothetical protein